MGSLIIILAIWIFPFQLTDSHNGKTIFMSFSFMASSTI